MLYIYKVAWSRRGAGEICEHYNDRADLHGTDLITAGNARIAMAAVKSARPDAVVQRPALVCGAESGNV